MEELKITNMVKFYTLLILSDKDRHGYELIKEIENKLGKKPSPGQIYPFLKLLKKRGLIVVETRGKREKKVYALTHSGRTFVSNLLLRFGDLIDMAVERKLSTCAHCGCRVYEGGIVKRIGKKKFNFCCNSCAGAYSHHGII